MRETRIKEKRIKQENKVGNKINVRSGNGQIFCKKVELEEK